MEGRPGEGIREGEVKGREGNALVSMASGGLLRYSNRPRLHLQLLFPSSPRATVLLVITYLPSTIPRYLRLFLIIFQTSLFPRFALSNSAPLPSQCISQVSLLGRAMRGSPAPDLIDDSDGTNFNGIRYGIALLSLPFRIHPQHEIDPPTLFPFLRTLNGNEF